MCCLSNSGHHLHVETTTCIPNNECNATRAKRDRNVSEITACARILAFQKRVERLSLVVVALECTHPFRAEYECSSDEGAGVLCWSHGSQYSEAKAHEQKAQSLGSVHVIFL